MKMLLKKHIQEKLNKPPFFKVLKNYSKDQDLKESFFKEATKLGKIRIQNNKRSKIIEITPDIKKIKKLKIKRKKIKKELRYHQTNLGGSIHSDGPQLDTPPKYVIMACQENSFSGGDTVLVNTKKIYNHIAKNKKEYLKILCDKFLFERRGFNFSNDNVFGKPIFLKKGKNFLFRYLRDYIEKGYLIKKEKISLQKKKTLDYLDKLLSEKKFYKQLKLNKGDYIIFNNHILAHGRTTFRLSSKLKASRKLFRIWLN